MNCNLIFLSLAIAWLSITSLTAQSKPQYEVYAIRYAVLPDFPVSELVEGAAGVFKQRPGSIQLEVDAGVGSPGRAVYDQSRLDIDGGRKAEAGAGAVR